MTEVSHAAYLRSVPAPPHDPRRIRLDFRAGWRADVLDKLALVAPGDVCAQAGSALQLAAHPDAALTLGGGATGSFGGLLPPFTVARAPDGAVMLLDRASGALKRFDGCACRFVTVPHTFGLGDGPRQLADPGGIAACGEMLLVADTGHGRISVFSFYGYVLRAHWTPPAGAVAQPWQPVAVAARRGRVVVADRANGALHFIHPTGRWLAVHTGFGAVNAVAFDRHGDVLVTADGADAAARVAWSSGAVLASETLPAAWRAELPPRPFPVSPSGAVELSSFCAEPTSPRWFDLSGQPLPDGPGGPGVLFEKAGSYISDPLDSRLHRCVWDRVLLSLSVPQGGSVRVLTYTAETPRTSGEIAALPPEAWTATPRATAASVTDGAWDALIRARPGRYLWLRLDLTGDGAATPQVHAADVDFPRISLRRYLPGVYGQEPVSADFTDRFLAVFDRGLRQIEEKIDRQADYFDPLSAPAGPGARDFLSWLAGWVGVTLDRQLPLAQRRRILKGAGKLFALRGTKTGLRGLLELYLGLDRRGCAQRDPCCGLCTTASPPAWQPPQLILEHFTLRRWLFVGTGRLGDDARLWGERIVNRSKLETAGTTGQGGAQLGVTQLKTIQEPHLDPFNVYAHRFSVFLPAWIARLPGRRRMVERLVRAESPAHTAAQIEWVAPRFRVGVQSMIGFDAVIGCYQPGIALGSDRLGKGTVLPSADGRDRPPALGKTTRVGSAVL